MQKSKIGPKLILASQSPRRRNLLEQARIDFSVIPSNFDEDSVRLSAPDVYVRQLAESKARDISEQYPASCVLLPLGSICHVSFRERVPQGAGEFDELIRRKVC